MSPNLFKDDETNFVHHFNYLEMVEHLTFGKVRCGLDLHNCDKMFRKPLDYNGITQCDGKCNSKI